MAAITRTFAVRVTRSCADLLNFAGLEEPEEETLHAQRHLADLVEKDGSVVRHLEFAGLVAIRTGETALHVSEKLGLEQRFGDAGAVDRDERDTCSHAGGVNSARDHFLAGAAFAGDQNLCVRSSNALNLRLQIRDRATRSNELHLFVLCHRRYAHRTHLFPALRRINRITTEKDERLGARRPPVDAVLVVRRNLLNWKWLAA